MKRLEIHDFEIGDNGNSLVKHNLEAKHGFNCKNPQIYANINNKLMKSGRPAGSN